MKKNGGLHSEIMMTYSLYTHLTQNKIILQQWVICCAYAHIF